MRWRRGCSEAIRRIAPSSDATAHQLALPHLPPPSSKSFCRFRSNDPSAIPTLAYEVVEPPTPSPSPHSGEHPPPTRTGVLLHGLLGSGRNWRSWTRRLASAIESQGAQPTEGGNPGSAPGFRGNARWRFVLVDLRAHGRSAGLPLPGPHSMVTAAEDVARLVSLCPWLDPGERERGESGADVVIAHSVGGKVALQYSQLLLSPGGAPTGLDEPLTPVAPPKQVWVLDSVPAAVGGGAGVQDSLATAAQGQPSGVEAEGTVRREDARDDVERVLRMVVSLPRPFESRKWLVQEVQRRGFSGGLAEWLGSSLRTVEGGKMEFQFDLEGALDLYRSYRASDLLHVLEGGCPPGTEVHMVRAQRSDRWTPRVLQRLEAAAAARPDTVKLHVLENAGHWLQADNPGGLVDLMVPHLARISG